MTGASTDAEMPTLPVSGVPAAYVPDERRSAPGEQTEPVSIEANEALLDDDGVDPEAVRQFFGGVFAAVAGLAAVMLGHEVAGPAGVYGALVVVGAVFAYLLAF